MSSFEYRPFPTIRAKECTPLEKYCREHREPVHHFPREAVRQRALPLQEDQALRNQSPTFLTQAKSVQCCQKDVPQRRYVVHKRPASLLLPCKHPYAFRRPLLVLDLDETLVHASVKKVPCDLTFDVPIESQRVPVFVSFRPYLGQFLRFVGERFEVAVFTASIAAYADAVLDYIDPEQLWVHHRLYREHCTEVDGLYIKDLSLLGRPLERTVIIDNSPTAYSFQPQNALPITTWLDDPNDADLEQLVPTLHRICTSPSVFQPLREHQDDML